MFRKILGGKAIARVGLIITGVTLLLVSLITYYGQNVGNFVMTVDEEMKSKGILLCSKEDFLAPQAVLTASPVQNARDTTYRWLNIEDIVNTDGDYDNPDDLNNNSVMAYTFYVRNIGEETTDLSASIVISDARGSVEQAIRIMLIKTFNDETVSNIYMAEEEYGVYDDVYPETTNFLNNTTVMEDYIHKFSPNQTIKFTIIMWLEGQDPQCNDSVMGGQLKLRMNFSAVDSED